MPFHMVWEHNELLMEKIFADYSKITDQDYLGLSSNPLKLYRKHVNSFAEILLAIVGKAKVGASVLFWREHGHEFGFSVRLEIEWLEERSLSMASLDKECHQDYQILDISAF